MSWCIDPGKYMVSDQSLARAYDITGEQKRAGMKQLIARLVDFYGINHCLRHTSTAEFKSGFRTSVRKLPFQELVFSIPSGFSAWNRLLAAVVPALTSGVPSIACLMDNTDGSAPSPEVLTALELAGIENIYLPADDLQPVDFSKDPEPGGFLCVLLESAQAPAADIFPESAVFGRLGSQPPLKGLIWVDSKLKWDFDLILQSHPGVNFTAAGPDCSSAPAGVECSAEHPDFVLNRSWDIFFGPPDLLASSGAFAGFEPGLEAFWLWPQIHQDYYLIRKIHFKEI